MVTRRKAQCVFGVAHDDTVTISGLTITNGQCGIYNDHGALTVSDCVVTGNSGFELRADGSFGPQAERGNDNRDAKKISGDCPYACLTIANSIISDNSGPGVDNFSAIATILNSALTGNKAGQDPATVAVSTLVGASSQGTSQLRTAQSVVILPSMAEVASLAGFRF